MVNEEEKKIISTSVNQRFRKLALVSDYFPMKLKNGAELPGVLARCPSCNKNISKGLLRGEVCTAPEDSFKVTAIGWCLNCDVLLPFLFHVVPYGTDTYEIIALEDRGWPETYESKVLPFEKKKKKSSELVVHAEAAAANSNSA